MNLEHLLLSQHQYIAAAKPVPYEYVLRSSKGRELVALGVFHSKPPIERLVALWDGFLKHEGEMVAMAEGRLRPVPTSLEEAVARRGE
ncbi:MAG TPA: hypothetical protein VMG09_02820, partial [Bacteroidota bacterium]|nr:hypothetical protein [Bacteroidota bacterium]